ncbi:MULTISPECIES: hypothetical protein [Paraburkholderia]|uniref:hypothetical protein n=1 Tax=Paraburkholderia TaxID=1822464 RepID=UPI0003A6089D|nr:MULTISPECIES: hypothetical protein [Paraburkholderia]MDH6146921.1 hypothetical protein [Paraburkholderia sp. WSM4179]
MAARSATPTGTPRISVPLALGRRAGAAAYRILFGQRRPSSKLIVSFSEDTTEQRRLRRAPGSKARGIAEERLSIFVFLGSATFQRPIDCALKHSNNLHTLNMFNRCLIALAALPFVLDACGGSSIADSPNPLASADQLAAEKLAITVVQSPAVIAAKATLKAKWLAAAQTTGGVQVEALSNLDEALDESVFAFALSLASGTANDPKEVSFLAAPHNWYGMNVPGSRTTFDNPDTLHRSIPVDPASSYVITGKVHGQKPVDFNFSLYSSTNATLSNLAGDQLGTNADGSFFINANSSPTGGGNQIQLVSGAASIFVRDTINEWGVQQFNSLTIKRTPSASTQSQTADALATTLAATLQTSAAAAPFIAYNALAYAQPANTLPAPSLGGTGGRLATQAASYAAFQLADDQALVLNVNLGGAKYFIAPAYGRWTITTDYINHTQTLNNTQAVPNPDGTYTFVISPKDPGVYNWVDTAGLHQGFLNPRWQGLPATPASQGPSASAQLVKLSDVRTVLPVTTKYVTAAERQAQLAVRAASYASRYAP